MTDGCRMTEDECVGAMSAPCVRLRRSPFVIGHLSCRFGGRGFTLVEIIIAMTILIIIAAGSIPTFRGLQAEQQTREPIEALTRLAKEARSRAMKERRPYQVVIHASGFTASRYLSPYLQLEKLNEFVQEVEQKASEPEPEEELSNEANVSRPTGDQAIYTKTSDKQSKRFEDWTEEYKFPQGMTCRVQAWYEISPVDIAGDVVRLWVFQPSGICLPMTVTVENEAAVVSVQYGALNADIIKETANRK